MGPSMEMFSMFLRLPGELRNHIYACLFASTRLTFGRRTTIEGCKRLRPPPHSLAILQTCRQVHEETTALWLGLVLFNFERTSDMLDKLSVLPLTILSQIRRVRVGGLPTMLEPPGPEDANRLTSFRILWLLRLLPGLCLDKLIVLGAAHGQDAYGTVEELVKYGGGWRELHFITPSSSMLGFRSRRVQGMKPWRRRPQPSTWNDLLLRRDGLDSGASVTIFRSTQSNTPGAVIRPHTRQVFEQNPMSLVEPGRLGLNEDEELLSEPEVEKELLVAVKRGRLADISKQEDSPHPSRDLRCYWPDATWAEIRFPLGQETEDEVDRYDAVDEYTWPLARRVRFSPWSIV
jgi:hypothetical protein